MTPSAVYICGPMTGLPDHNFPAFDAAAERLRELYPGALIVNPADVSRRMGAGREWHEYVAKDLQILRMVNEHYGGENCAVCLLDDWHKSLGAVMERAGVEFLGWRVCGLMRDSDSSPLELRRLK